MYELSLAEFVEVVKKHSPSTNVVGVGSNGDKVFVTFDGERVKYRELKRILTEEFGKTQEVTLSYNVEDEFAIIFKVVRAKTVWLLISSYIDTDWGTETPSTNVISVYGKRPSEEGLAHDLAMFIEEELAIAAVYAGEAISINGESIQLIEMEVK
jgi:hypothetical protein